MSPVPTPTTQQLLQERPTTSTTYDDAGRRVDGGLLDTRLPAGGRVVVIRRHPLARERRDVARQHRRDRIDRVGGDGINSYGRVAQRRPRGRNLSDSCPQWGRRRRRKPVAAASESGSKMSPPPPAACESGVRSYKVAAHAEKSVSKRRNPLLAT